MSDKTDYQKMYKKVRQQNVDLHNAYVNLQEQLRLLAEIPGVKELVKKYQEEKKV